MTKGSYARLHRRMIREKSERDAAELGAHECRRLLGEWAAKPGRTQAEIEALNGLGEAPERLDS